MKKALIIVDVQRDFLPGGALPVPNGDQVVGEINYLMPMFDVVAATRDWHPFDHCSFATNHPGKKTGDVVEVGGLKQALWPVHCLQESKGALFAPGLEVDRINVRIFKGNDPRVDSYSAFYDNARFNETPLRGVLQREGVGAVYVCGLATDYCVKATAIDAAKLGFITYVMLPACRGVNLNPGDVDAAVAEMERSGVVIIDRK